MHTKSHLLNGENPPEFRRMNKHVIYHYYVLLYNTFYAGGPLCWWYQHGCCGKEGQCGLVFSLNCTAKVSRVDAL